MSNIANDVKRIDKSILNNLLTDKTTKKNIIWATDNYKEKGVEYSPEKEITSDLIFGIAGEVIQSRVSKAQEEQQSRTRAKAEVFTPSWICNKMNNHCDEEWFGYPDSFNIEDERSWRTVYDKVIFPEGKSWQDYVESLRIEITCGEAPYIVSRYDTTTGENIPIEHRIGLLDRKLRVVGENAVNENDWLQWAFRAFQSVYGYEFQGDNLLIARINIVMTFIEYYEEKWRKQPEKSLTRKIANIVCWNFWQMDGITNTIPFGIPEEETQQLSLFESIVGFEEENKEKETPICRIYDWKANRSILFTDLKKE